MVIDRPSFRRKNIRLSPSNYVGTSWFFVTMCSWKRRPVFTSPAVCRWFLHLLRNEVHSHRFALHAYCLMPDHIHLLTEGEHSDSNLIQLVRAIKSKSTIQFQRKPGEHLWQDKFYDHILRRNESPDSVAWYIWMNPVRKGLCIHPQEFEFVGSFTGLLPKKPQPAQPWMPPWRKRRTESQRDAAESPATLQDHGAG
jgi:putative transposase